MVDRRSPIIARRRTKIISQKKNIVQISKEKKKKSNLYLNYP